MIRIHRETRTYILKNHLLLYLHTIGNNSNNEINAMWKQKAAQVISLVISFTGVIQKSLSQSVTILNLHPNTYIQLQKSEILGTRSIVRNFLNYK